MYRNVAERHRFSQRNMDVLDITKNELTTISVDSLLDQLPLWDTEEEALQAAGEELAQKLHEHDR